MGTENRFISFSSLMGQCLTWEHREIWRHISVLGYCLRRKRVEESSLSQCKMWLFNTSSFPTGMSNQMLLQLVTSRSSFMFIGSDLLDWLSYSPLPAHFDKPNPTFHRLHDSCNPQQKVGPCQISSLPYSCTTPTKNVWMEKPTKQKQPLFPSLQNL